MLEKKEFKFGKALSSASWINKKLIAVIVTSRCKKDSVFEVLKSLNVSNSGILQ